jgi:hypothetical protein
MGIRAMVVQKVFGFTAERASFLGSAARRIDKHAAF